VQHTGLHQALGLDLQRPVMRSAQQPACAINPGADDPASQALVRNRKG